MMFRKAIVAMIPLRQVWYPRYTFGPERFHRGEGATVRLNDDLRKTVVFLGIETPDEKGNLQFIGAGTGFWLHHDGYSHLVTCRHVAKQLEDVPLVVRCNSTSGTVLNIPIERLHWVFHSDDNVDVAAVNAGLDHSIADWRVIPQDIILTPDQVEHWNIGTGDLAYVIGLFRLLHGSKRNLPIVHSGNIALMPGDERLPVWDELEKRLYQVEGYLVEVHSLDGLSGSPVFARPTWYWRHKGENALFCADAAFLGLWQSSWGGQPAKEIAERFASLGRPIHVPLGLGVVVPALKILETLDMPELKKRRDGHRAEMAKRNAATTQSAPLVEEEANPDHREDFKRLLSAAVKRPKSSG